MTQNTKATLEKTIAFLRKKSNTVSKNAAYEIIGTPEDEARTVLKRVMTDFLGMGVKYYVREYNKNLPKSQEL